METLKNAFRELKDSYLEKSLSKTLKSRNDVIRQTSRMLLATSAMYGYFIGAVGYKLITSGAFKETIDAMRYFSQ